MTCKRRFGNSRFAGSYVPYGLFVLISLISLALAGCSGASPGAVVPEPTTGTLDMTPEPPQPTVTILADSDMVAAGDPVSYTVNASPAPIADLTVHVAYKNTGVELAEELPATATITIDAESGTAMRTVPTAPTSPDGRITASVTEGDGYKVGTAGSVSVSVTALPPTDGGSTTGPVTGQVIPRPRPQTNSVIINAVTPSVVEGNPVRFTVTAAPAPAKDLTLNVSVTQTGPTRTTGNLPTSVTIPASTTSMELPPLVTTNDSVAQGAGTVTATLTGVTSSPTTYRIGSPASATVTVTDDDGPLQNSVIITAVTDSVVEGNPVRFTVTAAPAPAKDLTLNVSVRETGPRRTTGTLPTSMTIPASNTSRELTLDTANDSVIERASTVTARLTGITSSPSPHSIGSPASATVTVTDDDGSLQNSVIIRPVTDSVIEGDPVRFRITAVPAPEEDLTLNVSVMETGPTRTPDPLPTSVTILESTGGWLLGLTTTDDLVGQRAGTVTATLTGVASGPARYRIGSPDSATVTVTDDDDLPTATIELPASVHENEILPITVHMTPALAADQTDQTVRVVVIDSGLNHSVSKLYSVTFGAGAGSQTVTMHTVIDWTWCRYWQDCCRARQCPRRRALCTRQSL